MFMFFRQSGISALRTSMEITAWGSVTLPPIKVIECSSSCHLSSKEEAMGDHDPAILAFSPDQVTFKCTEAQWKSVLWSDKSKLKLFFGKHGHILQTKVERNHLAFYQCSLKKPPTPTLNSGIQVLNWPADSSDFSSIKNIQCIMIV